MKPRKTSRRSFLPASKAPRLAPASPRRKPRGLSSLNHNSPGEELFLIQSRAVKLPLPEREVRFAPDRRWRFDFAWPDFKVALEVEGGIYSGGRHTRGAGFEDDCEKYSAAAVYGWAVIRATTAQVKRGEALAWVTEALARRAS